MAIYKFNPKTWEVEKVHGNTRIFVWGRVSAPVSMIDEYVDFCIEHGMVESMPYYVFSEEREQRWVLEYNDSEDYLEVLREQKELGVLDVVRCDNESFHVFLRAKGYNGN